MLCQCSRHCQERHSSNSWINSIIESQLIAYTFEAKTIQSNRWLLDWAYPTHAFEDRQHCTTVFAIKTVPIEPFSRESMLWHTINSAYAHTFALNESFLFRNAQKKCEQIMISAKERQSQNKGCHQWMNANIKSTENKGMNVQRHSPNLWQILSANAWTETEPELSEWIGIWPMQSQTLILRVMSAMKDSLARHAWHGRTV